MRGKRIDGALIDELDQLRSRYKPAEIVAMFRGRLPRRTVYRWLRRLRLEDEARARLEPERLWKALEIRTTSQLEYLKSRKRYQQVSDFPPNLRRVRSY
jgi:hypothetical protein